MSNIKKAISDTYNKEYDRNSVKDDVTNTALSWFLPGYLWYRLWKRDGGIGRIGKGFKIGLLIFVAIIVGAIVFAIIAAHIQNDSFNNCVAQSLKTNSQKVCQ